MKNIFIAILAVFYLTITSGIVMNIHYCMGKMESIGIGDGNHERCGKCGIKAKAGCCDTEQKLVKIGDEHQLPKKDVNLAAFSGNILQTVLTVILAYPASKQTAPSQYYSPPDLALRTIYLENCVFRI